jgi:hypothetical protein
VCSPPESGVPSGSQFPDIETAQTRDLVVERLAIRHRRNSCMLVMQPIDQGWF